MSIPTSTSPLLGLSVLSTMFIAPIMLFTSLSGTQILINIVLTLIALAITNQKLKAHYTNQPATQAVYQWLSEPHQQARFLLHLASNMGFHFLYTTPALCFVLSLIALTNTPAPYISLTTLPVEQLLDTVTAIMFAVWYLSLFTTLWHVANKSKHNHPIKE